MTDLQYTTTFDKFEQEKLCNLLECSSDDLDKIISRSMCLELILMDIYTNFSCTTKVQTTVDCNLKAILDTAEQEVFGDEDEFEEDEDFYFNASPFCRQEKPK